MLKIDFKTILQAAEEQNLPISTLAYIGKTPLKQLRRLLSGNTPHGLVSLVRIADYFHKDIVITFVDWPDTVGGGNVRTYEQMLDAETYKPQPKFGYYFANEEDAAPKNRWHTNRWVEEAEALSPKEMQAAAQRQLQIELIETHLEVVSDEVREAVEDFLEGRDVSELDTNELDGLLAFLQDEKALKTGAEGDDKGL